MKNLKKSLLFGVFVLFALTCFSETYAKDKKKGKKKGQFSGKMMRQAKHPYGYYESKGLFATGLIAVFPPSLDCPPIASPYGSKTRYDNSTRNNDHHGYHNGMDISLNDGTPVLSVANGEVIHKGTAGQLVGNYVWLRYAPEDTGVPNYIFARYQHLSEPAALDVGNRVDVGQAVGLGGNTGTTGGHFGSQGYAHLHLVFYTSPSPDYVLSGGPMLGPETMNYLDPMGLYLGGAPSSDNHLLQALKDDQKQVSVPVKLASGEMVPSNAKVVWPLTCRN